MTSLNPLALSLSEHMHPRSCFRELWELVFVLCFFALQTFHVLQLVQSQ